MATKTRAERVKEVRELRDKAVGLGVQGADDMSKAELEKAIEAASTNGKVPARKGRAKSTKAAATPAPEPEVEEEAAPAPAKRTRSKAAAKKAPATKATSKPAKVAKPSAKASKTPAKASKAAKVTPEPKEDAVPVEPGANPFRKGSDRHFLFGLLVKGGTRQALAEKAAKRLHLRSYSDQKKEPGPLDYDKRLLLTAQVLRDEFGYTFEKTGRGLSGRIKVTPPSDAVVRHGGKR